MDKAFFREILVSKPELFQAIVEFNCKLLYGVMLQLSSEMSEFTASVPGFDTSLTQNLSLWIIASRKDQLIETEYCFWDFIEETRRLALLEPELIGRLELVFGAAINAEEISKVLKRDEVLQIQRILGDELYQYSLLRGRYQLGAIRHFFSTQNASLSLQDRIQMDGRVALEICASTWPSFLQNFFFSQHNYHFSSYDRNIVLHEYPSPVVQGVWEGLKKILLREVAPQWTPFFD